MAHAVSLLQYPFSCQSVPSGARTAGAAHTTTSQNERCPDLQLYVHTVLRASNLQYSYVHCYAHAARTYCGAGAGSMSMLREGMPLQDGCSSGGTDIRVAS